MTCFFLKSPNLGGIRRCEGVSGVRGKEVEVQINDKTGMLEYVKDCRGWFTVFFSRCHDILRVTLMNELVGE